MSEIQNRLKVVKESLAELIGEEAPPANQPVTVRDVLAEIAKVESLPAEQKGLLAQILKLDAFEAGTSLTVIDAQEAARAGSDNAVAMNLEDVKKQVEAAGAEIAKMVEGKDAPFLTAAREAISKASTAGEKLAQVKSLFGITMSDDEEEWRVHSKISDLVGLLVRQEKLERLLAAGPAAKSDEQPVATTKAAEKPAAPTWPRDMTRAEFDAKSGVIKSADPVWGNDR